MAAPGPGPGQIHHAQMTMPQVQGIQKVPQVQGMHPQQQIQAGVPTSQPNPAVQQTQQVHHHHSQIETDPVTRFKSLLPRLKESLVNLFKVGGHLFYQNASQDETGVQIDNVSGRFEKSLEEFYGICDQIEIHLRLARETLLQDRDSLRNTPISIQQQKTDTPQPEGQLYLQYLSTVRGQISCAKDIRDLLHECLTNFPEHSHP